MSAGLLRVGVIGGDAVCLADMASLASGAPVTVDMVSRSHVSRAPDIVRKFMQRMTLESSLTLCISRSR